MSHRPACTCVYKVGGSLLDLPDLVARLGATLPRAAALVTGGGAAADAVRGLDRQVGFDERDAHWLCIDAMAFHARLLAAALSRAGRKTRLVSDREACRAACAAGELALIEPRHWLEIDERAGAGIEHRWQFTSDSIAAHVARRVGAPRLVLMKSTLPGGDSVAGAIREGVVDECFADAAAGIERVELVNLRSGDLTPRRLRWTDAQAVDASRGPLTPPG